jgi:hypothetical protein
MKNWFNKIFCAKFVQPETKYQYLSTCGCENRSTRAISRIVKDKNFFFVYQNVKSCPLIVLGNNANNYATNYNPGTAFALIKYAYTQRQL